MINVFKFLKNTQVEGPGKRFCIWVQGCKKHCPDCWAKDTWEFGVGTKYSVDDLFLLIQQSNDIEGVTFLGGEPFEQAQELSLLASKIKSLDLTILCFTGYTLSELQAKNDKWVDNLLSQIDLLIDGGFEKDKFDLSRPWVGSSNQCYHYLTDAYSPEVIAQYKNKIEARIDENGKLEINGMGDFEKIKRGFGLQPIKNNVK